MSSQVHLQQADTLRSALARHLPQSAVDPVAEFLVANGVRLRIARRRLTKLGDYHMPHRGHEFHEISVNGDLSPQFFLWVLLHEMAHLTTHLDHGRRAKPHGHEWQEHYRMLIADYARQGCFAPEATALIERYVSRVPLSREVGLQVERLLKGSNPPLTVADLEAGDRFALLSHPERVFVLQKRRRTRWECLEASTNRTYTVSGAAEVERR